MSDDPDIHGPDRQVAVLEGRMNTMQADLSVTLERFRADMAKPESSISDRIATAIDRTATSRWWQTAALLAGIAIATAAIIAAAG